MTLTRPSKDTIFTKESLYSKYILEREGKETIEIDDRGFCTYIFIPEEEACWLADIYVEEGWRRSGLCYKMADMVADIARENKLKWLVGSVDLRSKTATESMKVVLNYGFRVSHMNGNLLMFKKDLET